MLGWFYRFTLSWKGDCHLRTLLVEDSNFFRQLFKETLYSRFQFMEILEASNGEEALQKIETLAPALVFVDIKLPGENGLKLAERIKSLHPGISIVILTSYDWPEYREAAYQYTEYFLSKGATTRNGILDMVESILSKRGRAGAGDPGPGEGFRP